ncbi:MAG: hydantoinase B/oxoprolinase family protein [Terriglobales bacterium]
MGKLKERLIQRQKDVAAGNWPKLELLKQDPLRWELLYHQLLGMVQEGRETARLISASPTVREFGECVFALFTPEGESISFSRGILLHMASMGSSISWMLQNDYEERVGIHDGDIFYNNDPDIGGAHSADQAVLLPIFYKGELVAWVGGLSHCMEVGAHEPGGMSPSALSRYDDGQIIPCMKVGVNDEFKPDFHIMVERNTRDGKWWILDDKAKLAGCLKMKYALLRLIDSVGPEYFSKVCYEMIESGRQFAVNKTKASLFPGRYRSLAVYDIPNSTQPIRMPVDWMAVMPLDAKVERDGHLVFDYDGSSPAGYHSNNASYWACLGNHIYTLLQDVLADGFYNQGLQYSFDLKIPKGTVINADIDKACSIWMTAVVAIAGGLTPVLARAFYAKGIREEGFASKPTNGGVFAGGLDKNGAIFTAFNFEANCAGAAAQSNYDGLCAATSLWNPEVNMSDCETFEHVWPLMWLGRRVEKDGGGYGRRRGGGSVTSLYVIEHQPKYIESGTISSCDNVFSAPGIFGGYPAPARYRYTLRNTNYQELVENKLPLPHSEGEDPANPEFAQLMKGKLVQSSAQDASQRFEPYDLIHQSAGAGGGWGDPLNRDIADIERDLAADLISEWSATNVYKVVFEPGTRKIDAARTKDAREQERQARIKKAAPASQFVEAQKKKIVAGNLPPITKKSFNEIFRISEKFLTEFRECWGLPADFRSI